MSKDAGPAAVVGVAGLFGGELLVEQGDLGAAVDVFERDGDEGEFAGVPGGVPGELEQLVGDDLGVGAGGDAAAVGAGGVCGDGFGSGLGFEAVGSSDAGVAGGVGAVHADGAEPFFHDVGVGPGLVDAGARGADDAGLGEHEGGNGGGCGFECGHWVFS